MSQKTKIESSIETKINFVKLTKEKQIEIILENKLEELALSTIGIRLRNLNYKNIPNKMIEKLLEEIK